MKKNLSSILKKIAPLFNFHRPRFHRLDFIDVVLENKLLLLLSWELVHGTKITIRPGKAVYHNSPGAAICKLPTGTDRVEIKVKNLWRASTVSFPLKTVTVGEEALQFINRYFLSQPFSLSPIKPSPRIWDLSVVNLSPRLKTSNVTSNINISINHQQLSTYVP